MPPAVLETYRVRKLPAIGFRRFTLRTSMYQTHETKRKKRSPVAFWKISIAAVVLSSATIATYAQTTGGSPAQESTGTNTDLFVMFGSDFDRPGLVPRANYNLGIGHTFGFLKKDPIGDELTFGYTYENAGTHGWFHTNFGEHTEQLGVMKNFGIPHTKLVT